ncbi:hypothetical protein D3C84_1293140 [compost metagenome]
MQQNHRHATTFLVGAAETGQRQLDGMIRAVARLQAINILAQIAAQFGADQGNGE